MDTQNSLEKVPPFKYGHFGVCLSNFRAVVFSNSPREVCNLCDRDTCSKPISPICQVLFSNELRVKHHGVRMKHGGSTKMTRLVQGVQ